MITVLWGIAGGLLASPLVAIAATATSNRQAPKRRRVPSSWIALACAFGGAGAASLNYPPVIIAYGLAAAAAIAAAAVDAGEWRLPNVLTYPLAAAGLIGLAGITVLTGHGNLGRALAGGAIYGGWLFLASLTGLGPGDVKLAAAVGIWLGWYSWYALVVGMIAGQILMTVSHLAGARRRRIGGQSARTPLGPAITAGFVVALLLAATSAAAAA